MLPLLQGLNWDIFAPDLVVREFSLSGKRVDYALSSTPPRMQIFIEVKAVGQSVGADRQLFEYAFHEGIPLAILTDGREWNFFLPGEQGSYDERRLQKLNIVERPPQEASQIFQRYLQFEKVKSGEALENARSDYKDISKRKNTAANIPKAWKDLVSEADELLIELIAEKTETLCGFRPAAEDVEDFLLSVDRSGIAPPQPISPPSSPTPRTSTVKPVSERGVSYQIFDQTKKSGNAIDALIDILRTLANRNPHFLGQLSQVVAGRTRNHVAVSRENVYPLKPELAEYTVELVPGWWLGTNISNRDKIRIIRVACDVEKLAFGKDIVISLPNAG